MAANSSAVNPVSDAAEAATTVSQTVGHHRFLFLGEGVALIVLGLFAVLVPIVASFAATLLFGLILLLSGGIGLFTSFRARQAPGFWWSLASAVIAIVAGGLLLAWPVQGVFSLTLVMIAFFFAEGVASLFYSIAHRKGSSSGWGWMLASGIIDLALAVILFVGLPGTALWALGVVVGVNMIFGGWALLAMALYAHSNSSAAAAQAKAT